MNELANQSYFKLREVFERQLRVIKGTLSDFSQLMTGLSTAITLKHLKYTEEDGLSVWLIDYHEGGYDVKISIKSKKDSKYPTITIVINHD